MLSIELSGLSGNLAALIQQAREQGKTVEITDQGKVIARVVPAAASDQDIQKSLAALDELMRLGQRLDWGEKADAVTIVREARRDL